MDYLLESEIEVIQIQTYVKCCKSFDFLDKVKFNIAM